MEDAERSVECAHHGVQQATFVCQHLANSLSTGRRVGFFCAEGGDNLRPDAWCEACEEKRLSTGGDWSDESESFAGITLICGACYDQARALNT